MRLDYDQVPDNVQVANDARISNFLGTVLDLDDAPKLSSLSRGFCGSGICF